MRIGFKARSILPLSGTTEELAEKCPDNCRRGRLQPPGEREYSPGFSRGLTSHCFDVHGGSSVLSDSAVCVSFINSDDPKDQSAAEAGKMIVLIGRLKPPSSTVVRTFFSGLFSP